MTANGLAQRRLRSRSRVTATPSVASQARWYPPSPFTATTCPSAIDRAASTRAASPVRVGAASAGRRKASRGPQAGQATGSAWNRRSAGSRYSSSQAGQSGKSRIEV